MSTYAYSSEFVKNRTAISLSGSKYTTRPSDKAINKHSYQIMILNAKFEADLDISFRWGRPTFPCLLPVTDVFQLIMHWAEVQLWFVRVRYSYFVVGTRRLMPSDALQPKAYCTNPGL